VVGINAKTIEFTTKQASIIDIKKQLKEIRQ
jgi:hypothetical protein